MLKNILNIIGIFFIGAIGGIFAEQILWPYFVERPLFYKYRLEKPPVYVTKKITIQENVALEDAIEKVKNTVIGVRTKISTKKVLEGSGLIVTADGLVVTLAELVPQGSDFSFFWEGEKKHFQILKRDLKNNLALVKIKEKSLPTAGFANLEKIKLGERVFLVGATQSPNRNLVVNEGIVKSFGEDFIETNIIEKNTLAGSPLFDIEGQCLGLNTINKEGRVITIPISKIKKFIGL